MRYVNDTVSLTRLELGLNEDDISHTLGQFQQVSAESFCPGQALLCTKSGAMVLMKRCGRAERHGIAFSHANIR